MKELLKSLILVAWISTTLVGCGPTQNNEKQEQVSTETKNKESLMALRPVLENPITEPCITRVDQKKKPIEIATFLSDFIELSEGWNFTTNYGFGSYFSLNNNSDSYFAEQDTISGLFIYPCLVNNIRSTSYYAIKSGSLCIPTNPDEFRINPDDYFIQSSLLVKLKRTNKLTPEEMLEHLSNNIRISPETLDDVPPPLLGKQIIDHNNNYLDYFSKYQGYSTYGYGFISRAEFDEFIRQNNEEAVGFIVFRGFSDKFNPEKVRIVIVGVNSAGNLMLTPNNFGLEKSWPPK